MFAPDLAVLRWLAEHRTAWITRLSIVLVSASGSLPVIAALAVVAALLVVIPHTWAVAAVVGSAAVIAVVATNVAEPSRA